MECVMHNKMKMLFEKISAPNYRMDSYYADGLINKLSNCSDPEISFLASVPLISDLITKCWDKTTNSHISVKVFLTRMLAIASKNELHFATMFAKLGDTVAQSFRQINSTEMNPSLRVAFMEVGLAMAGHSSGIFWMFETGVWKDILSLSNEKHTVFVIRQTYKFASKLLWRLNPWGEEGNSKIKSILDFILKPIVDIDFSKLESVSTEDEEAISKKIEPSLQILLSVLTEYERLQESGILVKILVKDYKITKVLYMIFDRIRRDDITLLLSKLMFILLFAKIFVGKPLQAGTVYQMEDFVGVGVWYFTNVHALIRRRRATLVLDFCNACNIIFTMLWRNKNKIGKQIDGKTFHLENQLLFLCLVPSIVYVKRPGMRIPDEKIKEYISKLVNLTCEYTTNACHAMRDLVLELDPVAITVQSMKRISCLKEHLNTEQANLVFQAMFYILKEYDPFDENGMEKGEEDYEESQAKLLVLTYVLDIIQSLVKYHDITWHETLEIVCLYNVVFNILKRPNLSCKFVVLALNVIALTVKKFLQPNLTLLMESQPGSPMHELGRLIYMKMNDINWEIRDSALELLLVCTEISYIKFPPLQKQILENRLINLAMTIVTNDHEFYVQASALKCIGAASRLGDVWEQLKYDFPNLQETLISILCNNPEGIVRKEACNILCDIYQNTKLPLIYKHTLYQHMVSSAVSDFHWEVQLSALRFWRVVIQSLLRDQGMLDGTFPPVTFSRETRKIVTLTENEIKRSLLKVLDELATIGCLTVLIKVLNDDSEVDIIELALTIATEFLEILTRYKVPEIVKANDSDPKTVDELISYIKEETDFGDEDYMDDHQRTQKSDNVIESILNSDDINLLANIYESHLNLETVKTESSARPKVTFMKFAAPHLFITFLQSKDFKAIIEHKRSWKDGIRSFQSLLDDVLGMYDTNYEANSLDCY